MFLGQHVCFSQHELGAARVFHLWRAIARMCGSVQRREARRIAAVVAAEERGAVVCRARSERRQRDDQSGREQHRRARGRAQ
eukprot:7390068-Prymnesium_polylepis.1